MTCIIGHNIAIDNCKRAKPNAIMDCELLSKVYINLLDQKEPMFELKIDKPVSKSHEENIQNKYYKKVIKPYCRGLRNLQEILKRDKKIILTNFLII